MADTVKLNLDGIARIERFLDRIEDCDESITQEFQTQFEEQFNSTSDENFDDEGSEEYRENLKLLSEWKKEGGGSVDENNVSKEYKCTYKGDTTEGLVRLPDGEGYLQYDNGDIFRGVFDKGIRNRTGTIINSNEGCSKTIGTWKHGFLDGMAKIEICNTGGWIDGSYRVGVPHGYVREFGPSSWNRPMLKQFGRYNLGKLVGWVYKGQMGGGYIIGPVNQNGEMTGDDIVYVYPDFRTAIKGTFKDGILVSGKQCSLVDSFEQDGIVIPVFGPAHGPVFSYDPATTVWISSNPLLRDPWEESMVEVRASKMEQAGDGVFAKEDLPSKTIVMLFAGVRLPTSNMEAQTRSKSDYRIRLNADIDLDIPNNCLSKDAYCATLGHKVNHSFMPNAEWSLFEHPRFGLIRAVSSVQDIKEGEEITVNYGMSLSKSPEWYRVLWLKHLREDKKMKDENIARYIERNHEMTMKWIVLPESEVLYVPDPVGFSNFMTGNGELEDECRDLEAEK